MASSRAAPVLSSEKARVLIRRRILNGQLREGQPLAESVLGRELGVSRVPVREALISLEHDGLVEFSETGRCSVKYLTQQDFQELFVLRLALEGTAARLAGPSIRRDASALEKNMAKCGAVKTIAALTHSDLDFHEIILQASGNQRLLALWRSLRNELELWLGRLNRSRQIPLQGAREETLRNHRKLLECLRTQPPDARELEMQAHIQTWREWLPIAEPDFSHFNVWGHLRADPLLPIIYEADQAAMCHMAEAVVAAGSKLVGFANRQDSALDLFMALMRHCHREFPGVVLGACKVDDVATAALFVAHGAHFVIGSSYNPAVAGFCDRRGIAYLAAPGNETNSIISGETDAGSIKIFPCWRSRMKKTSVDRQIPRAAMREHPSQWGEAARQILAAWFAEGACAIGLGLGLSGSGRKDACNFEAVTRWVAETRAWISEVHPAKSLAEERR